MTFDAEGARSFDSRYRKDGSVMASYDEIDIVTRENGHWGIKCRSSFAPLIEIPTGT